MMDALVFMLMVLGGYGGMLLLGLLVNVLLFPEMWQQPDLPAWIRWLAGAK